MSTTRKLINLIVAPLILVVAILIAIKMIASKPVLPKAAQVPVVIQVETMRAEPGTINVEIESFGNTRAHLTTILSSQINGEVTSIAPDFEAGKLVEKDAVLIEIDSANYQSVLSSEKASLATAQQSFAEEKTRSGLAKEDWVNSGRELSDASPYALREPQLLAAQANVDASQALVEKAQLDLDRTVIRAPFSAIVETRSASPGNIVSVGTSLGQLFSKEKIEVRLPLTPAQASHLTLPALGGESEPLGAVLSTPSLPGVTWQASISRLEPSVDPKNQTIYLIGEISDPFENADAFLPIGAFVNARITGDAIKNAYDFPEVSVVEDAFVWVVTPEKKLARQDLEIAFSQNGRLIAKIENPVAKPPLHVISRPLASFREGQAVEEIVTKKRSQ